VPTASAALTSHWRRSIAAARRGRDGTRAE